MHKEPLKRWKTREVCVGNVGVGGNNPIRLQSMTTSSTRDIDGTVEQIMRLADAGCEIARVTVQGMKEADACEGIKNGLIQKGYTIPLVADIHFYPPAAMRVADFVDKVRINPGNFVDKRATFKTLEYNDESYALEIEKIEEKFFPLIEKCKKLKKAMRIGTNHGSLSDRIMNRFGDTPKGMVESALEFTRICRKYDYHEIIFSMKASNPKVMIQAYRLLVEEMIREGWNYPLHLGVTEAGEGEDGRVKSAIGIGTLLLDGIGDTIRISLTEDPWYEIDPCNRLVSIANSYVNKAQNKIFFSWPHEYNRKVSSPEKVLLHRDGSVVMPIASSEIHQQTLAGDLGLKSQLGKLVREHASVDGVIVESKESVLHPLELAKIAIFHPQPLAVAMFQGQVIVTEETREDWEILVKIEPSVIFFAVANHRVHIGRDFFAFLKEKNITAPVIHYFSYDCSVEDLTILAATEFGALLTDHFGEGIAIGGDYLLAFKRTLSFSILQGCRLRHVKTDYVSCPGCGRTLFDLQKTAERIRAKTGHLPGVKIAIMGCIVNGPGEMADADFGYVGSASGKIDLYVGKTVVEKNIQAQDADERLIELIKTHGRWVEKEEVL